VKKLNLRRKQICGLLLILFSTVLNSAQVVKVRVVLVDAHVRLKPTIDSMILAAVPVGTELESVGKTDEWYKVKLPPDEKGFVVTGYLHSSAVNLLTEEKPEEELVVQPEKDMKYPDRPVPQQPVVYRNRQRKTYGIEFGLRVSGSGGYIYPGDLNNGLKGSSDFFYHNYKDATNLVISGRWEPVEISNGGKAEFFLNFTPNIGVAFGMGYINAAKEGKISYSYDTVFTNNNVERSVDLEITAFPIKFSLYLGIPLGRLMKFSLMGGVGYYIGQFRYDGSIVSEDVSEFLGTRVIEQIYLWNAKENYLGYHGAVDLDWNLTKHIAFVLSVAGRYAVMEDLKGTYDYKKYVDDELAEEILEERSLWYGEFKSGGRSFFAIGRYAEKPTDPSWLSIRKAKIALTGVSVQIGLKIKFATFSTQNSGLL